MTDRTYSPSGWGGVPVTPGQHVLPGADLGREVPLPPQPPPERDHLCSNCDSDSLQCAACGVNIESSWTLSARRPVESPDLPIPEGAVQAAAEALAMAPWKWLSPAMQETTLKDARTAIAAALPHLRSLQVVTQVEAGRLLGRYEAAEEIASAIENNHGWQTPDQQKALDLAATIARSIGKSTTTEGA